MHLHEHDENNAPNQAKTAKPTDPEAHLATGASGAQPPLEQEAAHAGDRHKTAAGYFSIYETAHFGIKEMGVGRTFQTLLKINQKDGFDCPSCARPDPDGERKTAEFCENRAKARSIGSDREKTHTGSVRPPSYFGDAGETRRLDGRTGPYHTADYSPERIRPLRTDLVGRSF
jgi:hypothetical protein